MYPFNPQTPLWIVYTVEWSVPLVLLVATIVWRARSKQERRDITALFLFGVGLLSSIWVLQVSVQVRPYGASLNIERAFLLYFWLLCFLGLPVVSLLRQEAMITWQSIAIALVAFLFFTCLLLPPLGTPLRYTVFVQCKNNLKLIGLALHNYHDTYESLPTQVLGDPPMSWRVGLLPYLDQNALFDRYDSTTAWNSAANNPVSSTVVREFSCPAVPPEQRQGAYPFTAYAVPEGPGTAWERRRGLSFKDFADGTSNTIVVAEACGQQIPWAEPRDLPMPGTPLGINLPGNQRHRSEGLFSSYHRGGANVVLADGAVRFLDETTDSHILKALLSPSGGERVEDF